MRARLFIDGVETNDGRRLENSTWREEPLPLLMSPTIKQDGHAGATIVGTITDIRTEDDGWVTGELTTDVDLTGYAAEADFDSGAFTYDGDTLVFTGARLSAATLGTTPCWDGMVLE